MRKLRFQRFIKNIPTSKLGSLAVGLAEVSGKVVKSDDLLRSPIHNVECVFYETSVEVMKSIRTEDMQKVYSKTKYVQPFSINDESGTVNVDLKDAHVEFEKDRDSSRHKWVNIARPWKMGENEDFDNFCKENNIEMKGTYRYNYNETYIEPGDEIYILGKAEIRAENENNTLTMCKDENNKNIFLVSDRGEKYMLKWSSGGQKYSILISIILASMSLAIILIRN